MPHADPIVRLNAALRGRYRIDRELGVGGMATVYLADDLRHELYLSNESGSTGLYVRRLSDATGQVAVPSGGRRVSLPRWSTDGSAVLWMDFDSGEP